MAMLEVRNVSFGYGGGPVLRDVSFAVSPGEVVSVVGANGAGKTTLLRILSTLAVPDSGTVLADGIDVFSRPMRYRRQLGYLPERPALYNDMTVKEYLTYRAKLKGEISKRVRRRISEAVEMCALSGVFSSRICTLSIGTVKRVALADALLLRPRVLLLDDFLAGLDSGARSSAGEIFSAAAAFSAVIVTGHEIADFAKWTTRFLVLRDGVIGSSVTVAGASGESVVETVREAIEGGAK